MEFFQRTKGLCQHTSASLHPGYLGLRPISDHVTVDVEDKYSSMTNDLKKSTIDYKAKSN